MALIGLVVLVAVLAGIGIGIRNNSLTSDEDDWAVEEASGEDIESMFDEDKSLSNDDEADDGDEDLIDDVIPEGWTEEQFVSWLDGPTPEGWAEEQWIEFVAEKKTKLTTHDNQTEG
jgi:hypothetical protein